MEQLKIFPFIFLIAITALVVTLFTKGIFHTIILSVGIGIVLYITKAIWLPEGYKRYAVRLVSLGIALSAAFSFGFWPGLFENIIKAAIETDILKATNRESFIRLAQLEEKWLGISR